MGLSIFPLFWLIFIKIYPIKKEETSCHTFTVKTDEWKYWLLILIYDFCWAKWSSFKLLFFKSILIEYIYTKIYNHNFHYLFNCSFIFFCWLCNIAIEAVVLDILGACPSQTIFYSSYFLSSFLILWASPPKISGLLKLIFYKFLLTSTKFN